LGKPCCLQGYAAGQKNQPLHARKIRYTAE
jgi:hypothetical protein